MDKALSRIRDLLIIIGIYLYFISWVYIHFYYQQFGLSTEMLKIDYSSYLMYSYKVLSSQEFLIVLMAIVGCLFLVCILVYVINAQKIKRNVLKGADKVINEGTFLQFQEKYSLFFVCLSMVLIFPLLFKISRDAAVDDYYRDRKYTDQLKTAQFIFRKDADLLCPTIQLDSLISHRQVFYEDLGLIKNDSTQTLRLLGESDEYYIVLDQKPYDYEVNALPTGFVFFINKKDVLLSRIILRSQ